MSLFLLILQWLVVLYLGVQVVYLLFFSVAASLLPTKKISAADNIHRIRVFIPGYKEDSVIIDTARRAISHDYPVDKFDVVVIADQFSAATISVLAKLPITLIQVKFNKSTKGKALHLAFEKTMRDAVDIVVVLDADNVMATGFLHSVNNAYDYGYKVMQGHRTAKNTQTPFALLDACTEEINNHIFRRGHVAIGMPSALIGSGMAFDFNVFRGLLQNIGDTAGEDKEMEFRIIRSNLAVAFLDGSYVYDEKVSKTKVFSQQRSRWLAMQLEFFQKYAGEGIQQLLKGNIAFFDKVFQTFLLPRVMLVGAVLVWTIFLIVVNAALAMAGVGLLLALATALLLGIPKAWYNKKLVMAFLKIPVALWSFVAALAHVKKARHQFIHTPHGENAHT